REINYNQYLRNTIIGCLTVMIDRRLTGEFSMPDIRSSHDMALWLDLLKRGFSAYGIEEILSSYRVVPTSNTANKFKAMKDVWRVYREIEKLSFSFSLYNFIGYAWHAALKRI
ncbi:MAG: glycosyltransferase family 2 protein, partial [Bacteroidota bacterium]